MQFGDQKFQQLLHTFVPRIKSKSLRDLTHLYDAFLSKSFTDRVLGSRLANGGRTLPEQDGVLRRVAVAVQVMRLV